MTSPWQTDSLSELRGLIWATLARAVEDVGHPWRTPALATLGPNGPCVRTIVLREAHEPARQLVAHSDARAPKVRQLRADPRAEWLFHDAVQRVQLRAATQAVVHQDDEVARTAWTKVPEANRRNYRTAQPPGTALAGPVPAHAATDDGAPARFAVLAATVAELDWLWLAEGGHRRARFRWDGASWGAAWLVP